MAALKTASDHQVKHFPGVQTYAFRQVSPTILRMTEVYQDTKVFWDHIPEKSFVEEQLQALFDTRYSAKSTGVGVGDFSEGVSAALWTLKASSSPLIAGFVGRTGANPSANAPAFLSLLVPGGFADEDASEFTMACLNPLIRQLQRSPAIRTCAVFKSGPDAVLLLISDTCSAITTPLVNLQQKLIAPLLQRYNAQKFRVELSGDVSDEAREQVSSLGIALESFHLIAGYVVHPDVLSGKYSAPPPGQQDAALSGAATASHDAAPISEDAGPESEFAIPPPPIVPLFELVRDPHSREAKLIRFSNSAPGRSAHKYGSSGTAVPTTANDGVLDVPLLLVIRKLSSHGATDVEIPIDKLYCLLERLRWWKRSLVLLNRYLSNNSNENVVDEEEKYQIENFVQILSSYGYPPRPKDTGINISGLGELIHTIEWVWKDVIEPSRVSLASTRQVSYRALMEAFPIGSVVVGQAGGLAGAPVAYRIIDSYMSTQRSMFGGSKFMFTLGLEFVVNFGEHFCVCAFEEKIEEFEGDRDLTTLPVVPLSARSHDAPVFRKRGKDVAALGVKPVYRTYSSGSFFAHRSARDGAATAGLHQAGAGRAMVDNERGLMLGHAPGVSFDGAGTAIQSTLKVYRVVVRAANDNDSEAAKQERIKNAQLKLFKHLPEHLELITWPAVIAYSFTWKTWGHVLTSGLSEVKFSDEPWEQLVLPARTKELLYASARYNLSGAPGVQDLIRGKSQGALYLLYGPPGTGKTLTGMFEFPSRLHFSFLLLRGAVEAITEKFHLPLYTVSLGELGTSASEVDSNINNILALCAQWRAIVLLDEGDALLEQREKGQLQLNSLTGVLLRSLENFDGQLYITSNRLQHIDRAVLSRVTLALKYDALDANARASLWSNTLKRANVDLTAVDVKKLASYEVSGRELLHVVKLALALAYHRGTALNQEIILAALEESLEFRSHFPNKDY